MKQKTKVMSLSIEYNDFNEAVKCIQKILKDTKFKNYDRQLKNGCLYEWGNIAVECAHYREEMINDKWCIVIPSKMNDKVDTIKAKYSGL